MFTCVLLQSYQYQNLSEGVDRLGGQLRGDKECPFSGVTKSGRVWRKVPESETWSVKLMLYVCFCPSSCDTPAADCPALMVKALTLSRAVSAV